MIVIIAGPTFLRQYAVCSMHVANRDNVSRSSNLLAGYLFATFHTLSIKSCWFSIHSDSAYVSTCLKVALFARLASYGFYKKNYKDHMKFPP